jgi:hypothetical protein
VAVRGGARGRRRGRVPLDRGRARTARPGRQIADLEVGVLFLFAISSLGVYAIVLAGWSANNKYTLLGALRSSAQMFSYELALGLSWVGVILLAGSFRLQDIVAAQASAYGALGWYCFKQFPAFIVYLVAATAEVNRTPFDLPGGRDRARRRLPHRVLVHALRPAADGRVREHDHGGGGGHQPVPGRLAVAGAVHRGLPALVLRASSGWRSSSSSGCAARSHASATTSSCTSDGRCWSRWRWSGSW